MNIKITKPFYNHKITKKISSNVTIGGRIFPIPPSHVDPGLVSSNVLVYLERVVSQDDACEEHKRHQMNLGKVTQGKSPFSGPLRSDGQPPSRTIT